LHETAVLGFSSNEKPRHRKQIKERKQEALSNQAFDFLAPGMSL
jgi:hypothetical protein